MNISSETNQKENLKYNKSKNIDIIKNKINNDMFDLCECDLQDVNLNFNYSLKKNVFNPSKMSPPNDWINRLEKRLFCKNYNYMSSNKFLNLSNE